MRNWVDSAQDRDYLRALVNVALNLHMVLSLEKFQFRTITYVGEI